MRHSFKPSNIFLNRCFNSEHFVTEVFNFVTLLCLAHDISRIPILQYSPWFALACLKVNNAFCPSSKEEGKLNKIRSRSLVRRGSSKVSLTIIVIIIIYTCRHYHQHSLIIFMIFVVIICITIISIIIIFFVYTNAL